MVVSHNDIGGLATLARALAEDLVGDWARERRVSFAPVVEDLFRIHSARSQFHKGEPAKVAAFASLEVVDGEGIYLSNIEWTPDGEAAADRDCSADPF